MEQKKMKRLKCAYIGLMGSFLCYAFANFVWELVNEQTRYRMIWTGLTISQQTAANTQMMLMDLCLMTTILCIILFIKAEWKE